MIVLLIWIIILIITIIVGLIIYNRAVKTRKYFKCPSCGESFRTEFMDAQTCKVCGTSIVANDVEDVSDKTK